MFSLWSVAPWDRSNKTIFDGGGMMWPGCHCWVSLPSLKTRGGPAGKDKAFLGAFAPHAPRTRSPALSGRPSPDQVGLLSPAHKFSTAPGRSPGKAGISHTCNLKCEIWSLLASILIWFTPQCNKLHSFLCIFAPSQLSSALRWGWLFLLRFIQRY